MRKGKQLQRFKERLAVFPTALLELINPVPLADGSDRVLSTVVSKEGKGWHWRVLQYVPGDLAATCSVLAEGREASEYMARDRAQGYRDGLWLLGGIV